MQNVSLVNPSMLSTSGSIYLNFETPFADYMIFHEIQNGRNTALPAEFFKREYYEVLETIDAQQQIQIITKFVSDLLESTIDLKPEYSKWIDENIWDLF